VLHKKFPAQRIFVEEGGQTLDEIATARGISEDELRQELLNIQGKGEKVEKLRADAEHAFQTEVTVNSKGELIVEGNVLFQEGFDFSKKPKPTPVKGGGCRVQTKGIESKIFEKRNYS